MSLQLSLMPRNDALINFSFDSTAIKKKINIRTEKKLILFAPTWRDGDINRISERFYRVNPDRSRETGGTGLGLAIVKNVMIQHQGELKITSELGSGSTFKLIFPAERLIHKPNNG